ncbi:hypothetical protein Acor_16420 [Acrocarpospora corrugata]|uniref:Uncharacterized protein n=1 Tax=Acrocarpospora corrugata TaxID=35763 RepID=A0A5M3VTN1_9ACTN|nr:hypothetical protein [Acrocarpospora corrugata]GER99578.1 hypothetical protein Acor_16420 [Acrocarpospora corrugata]
MSRRMSVVVLLVGAVAVAFAFVGIVWAAGTGDPDLGGPVVVSVSPSARKPDKLDAVSTERADPVKPPPPQRGGDDDDEGDDDD